MVESGTLKWISSGNLYVTKCGIRSDCSYRAAPQSSLIWVYTVVERCFKNISADDKANDF